MHASYARAPPPPPPPPCLVSGWAGGAWQASLTVVALMRSCLPRSFSTTHSDPPYLPTYGPFMISDKNCRSSPYTPTCSAIPPPPSAPTESSHHGQAPAKHGAASGRSRQRQRQQRALQLLSPRL
jgi:hypothetical protein